MTITERSSSRQNWPRAIRLRTPAEFRSVYTDGTRKRSRSFDVFVLPTESLCVRFGVTTSRKLGKAHDRNRIRRRVREILRRSSWASSGRHADVVINPRRNVLSREFCELSRELGELLGGML